MTIDEQSGTITFSTSFQSTTTQNYLLVGDWNAPDRDSNMNIWLYGEDITATDANGTHDFLGDVRRAQHSRKATRSGGGGSSSNNANNIGDPAPPGDGVVEGGTNDGGEQINPPNDDYLPPTAHSGAWTNGANAYDNTDGTYATETDDNASTSFQDHGFGIPSGNEITGIEVVLEASSIGGLDNIDIDLSWDGGTDWTVVKNTGTLPSTDTLYTLGGNADTWGRTWSPSDFSNTNFRVRVVARAGSPGMEVQIDEIQVRVYHQTPTLPDTGGGGGGRI
jgi:hypothetical protein